MRRSRLIEPRCRARSISPHRQSTSRDSRSQSVIRQTKERKTSADAISRSEWFDTEITYPVDSQREDWLNDNIPEEPRSIPGRVVKVGKKTRSWQESSGSIIQEEWQDPTCSSNADTRRSILVCNVNPYHLVKKQLRDEDDLSDDLSDNALELEDKPSSLFDPSKVKSIERVPNRGAVAAIGGQRIRVFNEPREISDEDDIPVTRIPIPKVSPKRPPRRPKEVKTTVKSILKRGRSDGIRKSVLFNVNNVIFAPEKSTEMIATIRRISKVNSILKEEVVTIEHPIVPHDVVPERPKFITIPNIKEPKRVEKRNHQFYEARIVPEVKNYHTERKIDRSQKRPEVPVRNKRVGENERKCGAEGTCGNDVQDVGDKCGVIGASGRLEDDTDLEIVIEELKDRLPDITSEDMELIVKANGE